MDFIQYAKLGDNRWWKYLISFGAIILAFTIGQGIMGLLFYYQKIKLSLSDSAFTEAISTLDRAALGLTENLFYASLLLSFAPVLLSLLILIPKIHNRPSSSLFTRRKKFDFNRFFIGIVVMIILASVFVAVFLKGNEMKYNFEWSDFIYLFLICIVLVPIQVAAEEILIRGYLLQSVQQLIHKKWASLIIITIFFALLHVFNPEFKNGFWRILPAYLILSFLFGLITIIDDGLELAIGLHTGNNLFVSLILSTNDGAVQTPSIFQTSTGILVEILPLLLSIISIAAFLILKFIYRWNTERIKEALI